MLRSVRGSRTRGPRDPTALPGLLGPTRRPPSQWPPPTPPQAVLSDMESGVQLSGSERTADTLDGSLRGLSGPRTPSPPRRSSPGRGRSPRRGPSPACSDSSTLALIHSALHKRQLQVQVGGAPAPCRAAPESRGPALGHSGRSQCRGGGARAFGSGARALRKEPLSQAGPMEVAESEEADLSPEWEVLGQRAAEPGTELESWYRLWDRQSQDPGKRPWGSNQSRMRGAGELGAARRGGGRGGESQNPDAKGRSLGALG